MWKPSQPASLKQAAELNGTPLCVIFCADGGGSNEVSFVARDARIETQQIKGTIMRCHLFGISSIDAFCVCVADGDHYIIG